METQVAATQPEINIIAPENLRWPYPMFRRLLLEEPVFFDKNTGSWVVSRYEDVNALLRDARMSADRYVALADSVPAEQKEMNSYVVKSLSMFMLNVENPTHFRLRNLTNRSFTPRSIAAMRPSAHVVVNELLDAVQHRGHMDVVADLAYPMPIKFICGILGMPVDDMGLIKQLSDDVSVYIGSAGKAAGCIPPAYHAIVEFSKLFRPLVEARRQEPKDDLISSMVTTRVDGDSLSDDEVIANCILFLVAGFETVTNLIACGTLALLEHPEQLALLKRDSRLMEGAIDEMLRYYPPVNRTARLCVEDIPLRGKVIKKGQIVVLMLGAGNRDPSEYPDPDRFDIARDDRSRPLSFGGGHHFCIGSHLARMEGEVALSALLQRMPNLRLATQEVEWRGNSRFRGLKALPVSF
ncbi:cytochrome [Sorangium cellulosum]|uniref:Cytochrome n=1 Tax=Sorangium cellulosum TaxID=56 RepID=A0A150PML4_SORCE|nr:cytochrome [Sorangium cellulosum]